MLGNRQEMDVYASGDSGGATVTRFAYDMNGNAWADLDGSNTLTMRRLYLQGVDALFARIGSGGTAAWFLADRLGSVRDITDNVNGTVIDHLDYDGYGNVTTETNSANGDRYKWTGREFDATTGLQYNRARYYDPKTGRWTSQDPMGFAAGDSNLYRYVSNGPILGTDPSGLASNSVGLGYFVLQAKVPSFEGVFTLDGTATSSAEKGVYTPPGKGKIVSTDEEVQEVAKYAKQYDGPTEFTGKYKIVLKADGKTLDPDKSTVLFKMVYYTWKRKKTKEAFETFPIQITGVALNKTETEVESFQFQANDWYPGLAKYKLVNAGLTGQVDLKNKTGEWTGKYQSTRTAAITIWKVVGKIK